MANLISIASTYLSGMIFEYNKSKNQTTDQRLSVIFRKKN